MFVKYSPSPEVLQAVKLEGSLKKAKPGTLLGIPIYQKRYCRFLEDGRIFAYADKREDFDNGHIKGQIPMKDIKEITIHEGHPKKFDVHVERRKYEFEAKTAEEGKMWVDALKKVRDFALNWNQHWEAALKDLDSGFVAEDTYEDPNVKTEFFILQPIHFLKNTAKKVVVEGAVGKTVTIAKKVGELFSAVKSSTNENYLRAKKFDETLNLIEPSILKSRVVMGCLLRESKELTGLGIVDNLMVDTHIRDVLARRWCLLISSKPLLLDEMQPNDDVTLNQGSIPIGLDFDTLYLFDEACDNSPPMETIPLKDVLQVSMRKKIQTEILYRFVLDLGDHKFNLVCHCFSEIDMWLRAIQTSRATIAEYQRSALPTLKNINWIIVTKDGVNGEQLLNKKIEQDYDNLTKGQTVLTSADVSSLIAVQEKVASEYLNIINSCLADRHQRIDIIKMYEQVYHENILNAFKSYFNRNVQDLQNKDIFEIVKFLSWYQDSVTLFGSSFLDIRIKEGIQVLCEIAARRILKFYLGIINNILKETQINQPDLDARGRLASKVPGDVFKLLNECLNTVLFCRTEVFILALLKACRNTLEYFQSGMEALIKEADLSREHLVAICNDVMTFLDDMKEFVLQFQSITTHPHEVVVTYFDDQALCKSFAMLGKKSEEKLGERIFLSVAQDYKTIEFQQIDLDELCSKVLKKAQESIDKLHPNYINKLHNALFQQIVAFYVQSFLKSFEKKEVKLERLDNLVDRLRIVQQNLKSACKGMKVDIDKILSPIQEFEDFLTRKYTMLTLAVQNMKESYGDSLKWPTVELLLRLREDDIPEDEQEEVIRSCRDIFRTTEKTKADLHKFNVFKNVEQNMDISIDHPVQEVTRETTVDVAELEEFKRRNKSNTVNNDQTNFSLEGKLIVDSHFLKDVIGIFTGQNETKYFSIKKEQMHCYKDIKSETAMKTFNLKDAVECRAEQDKTKFVLRINRPNKRMKDYRFTAENEQKRNQWVKTINDIMSLPSIANTNKQGIVDVNLYKSITPLFTEIEKMPSLQYEYVKPRKIAVFDVEVEKKEMLERKRTLMLIPEDDISTEDFEPEPMPKPGLCALLCMSLGIFKTKSYSSLTQQKPVKGKR